MQDLVQRFVYAVGRFLVRVLFELDVEGTERIPATGPAILMNNHINFTDVSVILMQLPRQPVGFAKRELLRWPLIGWFVRGVGVIPVRRGEGDRHAIRSAERLLGEGRRVLMIAPEGTRSGHGRLQEARDGLAYIALRSGAAVVPVAVSGNEKFWANVMRLRRTRARITVGEPFHFDSNGAKPDREMLSLMTREAMYRLARLLPANNRGVYADLENATEHYIKLDRSVFIADACGGEG
jgi:1-acyl-sn-glycerol-3-phosphate acyltransferase